MINEENFKNIVVDIMGKKYPIKCPIDKVRELQDASASLDKEMKEIRESGKIIGFERIAIIAALNISYKLSILKSNKIMVSEDMIEKLNLIMKKISNVLIFDEE